MSNKKISQLTEKLTSPSANDLFIISDSGESKSIKFATIEAVLKNYTDAAIAALVASAPETLDTLNELASALADDANFASTISSQIGTKADSDDVYTKIESDASYEPKNANIQSHVSSTSNPHSVTKAQVGLGNVDNTSDESKPISSATQSALDAKAPLVSPSLTGVPTAPTASFGTSTTQIASTAFVQNALAPSASQPVSALDVDWAAGETFYKSVSANSTFTFSNVQDGKGITLVVTNTGGASVTITLPSGIYKETGALTIAAGRAAVYSFVRINSNTYMSQITDLNNA